MKVAHDRLYALHLCRRCPLQETRKMIVLGRGVIPADILFIGEAPGRTEDLTGEAFIGQSGRMLQALVSDTQKSLGKYFTSYITNTVLCRPCDKKGGENRQPKPEEVIKCRPNMEFTIQLVRPKLAVLLGKISQAYCEDLFQDFLCLPHPSFLISTGGINSPHYLPTRNKLIHKLKEVL